MTQLVWEKGKVSMARQKTVYPTREIPHLWMHSYVSVGYARNAQDNLYFRGDTIYSYRDSFPIARHTTYTGVDGVERHVVLFTTRTYSNTTAKHLSLVIRAIPDNIPVLRIPDVTRPAAEAVEYRRAEWTEALQELRKLRDDPKTRKPTLYKAYREFTLLDEFIGDELDECGAITADDEDAGLCGHGSGGAFSQVDHRLIRRISLRDEFAALREAEQEYRAKIEERTERGRAERSARYAQRWHDPRRGIGWITQDQLDDEEKTKLERWRMGENVSLPAQLRPVFRIDSYLKHDLSGEPDMIVSSLGARFPVSHARRILELVRSKVDQCINTGTDFDAAQLPARIHLGVYTLDRIEKDGSLRAGCHWVEAAEVKRLIEMVEGWALSQVPAGC